MIQKLLILLLLLLCALSSHSPAVHTSTIYFREVVREFVLLFMSQVSHIFCVCLSSEMKSDGKGDELAENEVEDGRQRRSRLEDRKKSEGK